MTKGVVSTQLRRAVTQRAGGCCEYCYSRSDIASQSFTIDHITPVTRGGTSDLDNLALACQGCNSHKSNRIGGQDPLTGEVHPLFHPRQQRWNEHFAWNEDFTVIVGLSEVGRVTIAVLRLNRPGLIHQRRILVSVGLHPPLG